MIGTQNPITMGGRRAVSTALQRRLINTELPEYKPEEIKSILLAKSIKKEDVESLVEIYENSRTYALKNHLSPAPNFRNLINLAKNISKSMNNEIALAHTPEIIHSKAEKEQSLDSAKIQAHYKRVLNEIKAPDKADDQDNINTGRLEH